MLASTDLIWVLVSFQQFNNHKLKKHLLIHNYYNKAPYHQTLSVMNLKLAYVMLISWIRAQNKPTNFFSPLNSGIALNQGLAVTISVIGPLILTRNSAFFIHIVLSNFYITELIMIRNFAILPSY